MSLSEYIKQVCKIGQGADCCRYLGCGAEGFECLKFEPGMKQVVDRAWAIDEHVAQGDNCAGQQHLLTAEMPEAL